MRNRNDFWKNKKILPTITTITPSLWREKIKEAKKLALEEAALFPTCLPIEERKELYNLLKETKIKKIPFVHIRTDMELWELDFLSENFKTEVFNIHGKKDYLGSGFEKYKDKMFVENTFWPLEEKEIEEIGGICLDFSHLENDSFVRRDIYGHTEKMLKKYGCGCNHIGAIRESPIAAKEKLGCYDTHYLERLSELDYLKKYPLSYFSDYIAIELENSVKEQLEIKNYIINLIK